jgi:hypothetical protein
MKNIIKLNKQDLDKSAQKIIKEDIQNNKLYNDLKSVIRDSISSKEEIIDVLKYILDEKEGHGWVTKEKALKNLGESDIKKMLRESLNGLFEDNKEEPKIKRDDTNDDKEGDGETKVEYDDIINFFKKHDSIKQVGIFREAGFSEKEIYTRLPYKKLNQEQNEEGGTYRFTKDEVDRVRTVLSKYPGGGKVG